MRKRIVGSIEIGWVEDGEPKVVVMDDVEMVLQWHEANSMDRPETNAKWFEVLIPNEQPAVT